MPTFNRDRAKTELGWSDAQIDAYLRSSQARQDSAAVAAPVPDRTAGSDPLGALAGAGSAALDAVGGPRTLVTGAMGGGGLYGLKKLVEYARQGGMASRPSAPPVSGPVSAPGPVPVPVSVPAPKLPPSLYAVTESDIAKFPQFANLDPGQTISRRIYEKVAIPEAHAPVGRVAAKAAEAVPVRTTEAAKVLPMRPSAPAPQAVESQLAAVGSGAPEAVTQAIETPRPDLKLVKREAVQAAEDAASAAAKGAPAAGASNDALKAAREAVLAAAHPTDNPSLNAAAKKAVVSAVGQEAWESALRSARQAAVGAAERFPGVPVAVKAASRAAWYTSLKALGILDRVLNIVTLPLNESTAGQTFKQLQEHFGITPRSGQPGATI